MSVQAGIWNFDQRPVDPRLIASFSESLKQQGPDSEFTYIDGSIALLYRPFHTTAESRRENQPYTSQRGFILTWDGRLDNREEVIADLRGKLEARPTDVAIVAAAFDRWETESFQRIIGDWAMSIWKPDHQELILAIDYMAIRHIFYYLKQNQIWWSTDLASLVLLSRDRFHIDDNYIAGYLAHEPDADLTPYREIREVPPGQCVRIRSAEARVERYWRFSHKSRIRYRTDAEYEEHFRHVFRQAVRRRLRSDSPILAELSGGLDSSSIVCIADEILAKENGYVSRVDTISYYDEHEPNGDDAKYFKIIEEFRGKIGAHVDLGSLGDSPASFKQEDFVSLPGYLTARRSLDAARASIVRNGAYRVVLSGLGGDEFMGGIPDPRAQLADLILQAKLGRLAKELSAWSLIKRKPWVQLLSLSLIEALPVSLSKHLLKEATPEPWIEPTFARRTRLSDRLVRSQDHFCLVLPTRRSYLRGVLLMAAKLSKFSTPSAEAEEGRYPYLDQCLIKFMLSIPASQLLRPGERRSLMRRALAGLVPAEVLSRRTKQFGARTPVVTLQRNWRELEDVLESPLSARYGYISRERLLQTLEAMRRGKEAHLVRTSRIISFEFWLRDLVARDLIDCDDSTIRSVETRGP